MLPIIEQQYDIALLIHNQPLHRSKSILHQLKTMIRKMTGNKLDVIEWAKQNSIRHYSMQQFSQMEIADRIRQHNIDVLISYHAPILKDEILQAPNMMALNAHPSDLPSYRGGSPLLWQIINGVRQSAVSVHLLSPELDCGDILHKEPFEIADGMSKVELNQFVDAQVGKAIISVLQKLEAGVLDSGVAQPQASPTAYACNVKRDAIATSINWSELPGRSLYNLISYLKYFPIELSDGAGVSIWLPLKARSYLEQPVCSEVGLVRYRGHWYFNSTKGAVRLKYCWSPVCIFRQYRLRRSYLRGQLRKRYI